MSVLKRMSTMLKSNLNDLVDGMQDPGKELDQLVRDMEESVASARGEVASALADEKRLVKQIERVRAEESDWEGKAAQAVRAGDDALARQALARQAEKAAERGELERELSLQKAHVDQLTAGLKALQTRIQEIKLRQGTLREQARAAKGVSPLSGKTRAFQDFDRMSHKIDSIEAEAGLDASLTGRDPAARAAEEKLHNLSEDAKLDDALAALKKKLDRA